MENSHKSNNSAFFSYISLYKIRVPVGIFSTALIIVPALLFSLESIWIKENFKVLNLRFKVKDKISNFGRRGLNCESCRQDTYRDDSWTA